MKDSAYSLHLSSGFWGQSSGGRDAMGKQNQAPGKWLSHRGHLQQWQWPVPPPNSEQRASPGRRVEEEVWI